MSQVGCVSGCGHDKIRDDASELLTGVFLQEMAGTQQVPVWLASRAGDVLLKQAVSPPQDWILLAEGGQEGLLPVAESRPCLTVAR